MIFIKFIFPQNYNFSSKILGVIDYSTAVVNLIWFIFIFCFFNIFLNNLTFKICFIIIFYLPLFIFSIVGFNNENIIYVLFYILKFIKNKKIYLFNKSNINTTK